jgi:peptidyl-prolyl cis-trans isomerase D
VASDIVDTNVGPVILRVTAIEPAIVKPFEEVATQLRREIATARVKTSLRDLRDKIEDQRASAKPVGEVAAALNLPSVTIDAVDASGRGKDGNPIADIPDSDLVLKAAFQSEVGGDNDAVSLRDGGFVWFDVAKIDPARDRPLAEVRTEVVNAWTADQRSVLLAKKAAELVKSLDGGAPIADLAKEAKLEVNAVEGITRSSTPPGLSPAAVNAVFSVKPDGAGYALGADGLSRIVFKVKAATLPPADPAATASLTPRLRVAVEDDLAQAYVQRLESDYGISIDQAAAQAALRGSDAQQ